MTHRRLTLADLVFGEPLRWDIFGPGAKAVPSTPARPQPLLQKGQVLAPSAQLNGWLEEGLFAEATPSVLHQLNESNKRLERLLMALRDSEAADDELRAIARDVIAAVDLNPDVALACIFLSQIAGLYAVRHCIETAVVVVLVAHALGRSTAETVTITAAALTMNVGMVRQTETFQGKDSALSPEERAAVQRHPMDSANMLRSAGVTDQEWLDYVMLHHENDDGSGYPEGRKAAEIPPNARLISLADRYCAHVSARNYRRSILPNIALQKLFIDGDVDRELAGHFIAQVGAYPPGSLVRLACGEVGVVTARPMADGVLCIHALRDGAAKPVAAPAERTTASADYQIVEALHEDQAGIRFSMKQIWGELAAL